jgi:hypothetical protein
MNLFWDTLWKFKNSSGKLPISYSLVIYFSKMPMFHTYFMSILTSVDAGRRHHAVSTVSRFPTNISQKLLIAPSAMFVGL